MEIRSRQEKTHTPGPWKYDWAPKGDNIISIYHTYSDSGYVRYVCDTIGTDTPLIPENEANARLIAAAPDMAEALKGCKDMLLEARKQFSLMDCPGHASAAAGHFKQACIALKKAGV